MKLMKFGRATSASLALTALVLSLSASFGRAADANVGLNDTWQFTKGEEFPGAAGSFMYDPTAKSLNISYDFSKGGQYVAVFRGLDPAGNLTGVKVTAKGPGGGLTVALTDSTGQTLLYRLGLLGETSMPHEIDLTKPSDGYGGANDKKPHFPLKGVRLTVEKDPTSLQGKLIISGVTLETAP